MLSAEDEKAKRRLEQAAPYLLEALKDMVAACEPCFEDLDATEQLAFAKARVAIAKAEGVVS